MVLLFALPGCDKPATSTLDGGTARCEGGYGVTVHVTVPGACGEPLTQSQLRLSSQGAEHVYDFGPLVADISEPWPPDFHQGDPGLAELTASSAACTLTGSAGFTVDPEACVALAIAATCTCAGDASPR